MLKITYESGRQYFKAYQYKVYCDFLLAVSGVVAQLLGLTVMIGLSVGAFE